MKTITAIIIMFLLLTSCGILKRNTDEQKSSDEKKEHRENIDEKNENIGDVLRFGQPVLIDSSEFVIYPLLYIKGDDENFIERKIYDSPTGYINLIFYNTITGEYHLLDGSRKMLIHNFMQSGSYSSSEQSTSPVVTDGMIQARKNIFYTVTTSDKSSGGKFDNSDPKYLFVSDSDGKNFRQISPDNYNVVSWKITAPRNVVLILTVKDTNGNRKFDKEDETVPFVFDMQSGKGPEEMFSDEFMRITAKTLKEQWNDNDK